MHTKILTIGSSTLKYKIMKFYTERLTGKAAYYRRQWRDFTDDMHVRQSLGLCRRQDSGT